MASQAASQSKYAQAMSRRQLNAMAALGGTKTSALPNFRHMKVPDKKRTADFRGPPREWPAQARKQWNDRLVQMRSVKQKDRIKFWNIVPGDYVRVTKGNIAAQQGLDPTVHKIRPEGFVTQIDRLKNVAFLVDSLNPQEAAKGPRLAPLKMQTGVSAQLDYLTGYTSGYTDKSIEVPAAVPYANLQLRVSNKDNKPVYAHRMARGHKVWFDQKTETLRWDRFAIVKQPDGTNKRVKVDWPELPDKSKEAEEETSVSFPSVTLRPDVESETWLPWSPEQPVFLPPKAPWESPYSIAQTAKTVALMRAQGQIKKPMTPNEVRALNWRYQGFWSKKSYKPLPVPQPPTPGEVVAHERKALAQWYEKYGGSAEVRSFAPVDYLQFAPVAGPAAGGNWRLSYGNMTRSWERDLPSGKLANVDEAGAVNKVDLDAMPIELLMAGDLENRRGLAWRMKRYKERKVAEERKRRAEAHRKSHLLGQFRAALAEQKAREEELETGVTREELRQERELKGDKPLSVIRREVRQEELRARRTLAEKDAGFDRVVEEVLAEKEAMDETFIEGREAQYSNSKWEKAAVAEQAAAQAEAEEEAEEAARTKAEAKEQTDKTPSSS